MFPGAAADRNVADYVLLGAPLDVSTTFQPGTRFGPDRIRQHARTFDDFDHHTGLRFSDLGVHDGGDLHAWDDAAEYIGFLEGMLSDVRDDGALGIPIGGEHTVSLAGVRAFDPDVFVCLDAHLDLRSEYDGNPMSHATITRQALDVADRAIIVGARTGSEDEWERASENDVTVIPPDEVTAWTSELQVQSNRILDQKPAPASNPVSTSDLDLDSDSDSDSDSNSDLNLNFDWGSVFGGDVYLSVDIDGADPAFAPGTGTMEPFGLMPREMHDVVRALAPHCTGFDVVEVNDRDDGQAAALAGKLLRAFVYEHAARSE
ncbi:arginase family protein [Halocatena marina]|uniref:arginase family protein n=1 Tax=Halocatena marina TaxID=2934937 RepID=UPI00200FCED8|nr:arginase family protein [Halocatena marina]